MAGTPEANPNSEEPRRALLARCNKATGNTSPILAEVMSFFPGEAEFFIHTQEYASSIVGQAGVWYSVRHQRSGTGLDGHRYSEGEWENLQSSGPTGAQLTPLIEEIQELRGEADEDHLYLYLGNVERIHRILKVSEMPEEPVDLADQMAAKVLEVMQVTPEELQSLRDYVAVNENAAVLRRAAAKLRRAARNLQMLADAHDNQADIVINEAAEQIMHIHFPK
jgi:hypothetical protein